MQRYPTDVTEAECTILALLIPTAKRACRPYTTDVREVVNAIFHVLRGGCQWRLLLSNFSPTQTISHYFQPWRWAGVWERMYDRLYGELREASDRVREPSAEIIGS